MLQWKIDILCHNDTKYNVHETEKTELLTIHNVDALTCLVFSFSPFFVVFSPWASVCCFWMPAWMVFI